MYIQTLLIFNLLSLHLFTISKYKNRTKTLGICLIIPIFLFYYEEIRWSLENYFFQSSCKKKSLTYLIILISAAVNVNRVHSRVDTNIFTYLEIQISTTISNTYRKKNLGPNLQSQIFRAKNLEPITYISRANIQTQIIEIKYPELD